MAASSGGHSAGQIVRVGLKNFMMYDLLEFKPTAGLNLIVGVNEAILEPIMAAICLGLGSDQAFKSEIVQPADFIKSNCKNARTVVELHDPEANDTVVIGRKINSNGASSFRINGNEVSEDEVTQLVKDFNISVNSLCHFLPQCKVPEVVKMNSKQLLNFLQQAVSDKVMQQAYEKLLQLQHSSCDLENKIRSKQMDIVNAESKAAELKEMHNSEKREEYIKKLEKLQQKKIFLEYYYLRIESNDRRSARNTAKESAERAKCSVKDAEEANQFCLQKLEMCENRVHSLEDELKEIENLMQKNFQSLEDLNNQVYDCVWDCTLTSSTKMQADVRLREAEVHLASLVNEHEVAKSLRDNYVRDKNKPLQEYNEAVEEYAEMQASVEQQEEALELLRGEIEDLEDKIRQAGDPMKVKFERLKSIDKDAYSAACWLKLNSNKFEKRIYDPLLTQINITSCHYAKVIENHIPLEAFTVFLCESENDAKLFVDLMYSEYKWKVNVALIPDVSVVSFVPEIPVECLREKYPFTHYLIDLLEAPDAVIQFLCKNYYINNTPVTMNSDINDFVVSYLTPEIAEWHFRRFYTTETMHIIGKSRYGGKNVIYCSEELREKNILLFPPKSEAQKLWEEKQQAIKAAVVDGTKKLDDLINKLSDLFEKVEIKKNTKEEDASHQEKIVKDLEDQISNTNFLIQRIRNNSSAADSEMELFDKSLSNTSEKRLAALQELYNNAEEAFDVLKRKCFRSFCYASMLKQEISSMLMVKQKKAEWDILKDELKIKEQQYHKMKVKYTVLLHKVEKTCGVQINPNNREDHEKLLAQFEGLPGTIREIESEQQQLNGILGRMESGNEQIADELEKLEEIVTTAKEEVCKAKTDLESLNNKMKMVKLRWLIPLNNLISRISRSFSECFEYMGCVGEICLETSGDVNDFENYSLRLLVKFDNTKSLEELSHSIHSEEEYYIAMIVFMLCLQMLLDVPFRCVDDITRVMDSYYGRCIFDFVSQRAERAATQYLMFCSKVVPDLMCSDSMKVHMVMCSDSMKVHMVCSSFLKNKEHKPKDITSSHRTVECADNDIE